MSVKVMAGVWMLQLPPQEKLLLLAYADYADHDGSSVFPSVGTIAAKVHHSDRWVQYRTRQLERRGLLVREGRGRAGTNRFRVVLPEVPQGANPGPIGVVESPASSTGGENPAPQPPAKPSSISQGDANSRLGRKGIAFAEPARGANRAPATRDPLLAGVQKSTFRGAERFTPGVHTVSPEPSLIIREPPTRAALTQEELEKVNALVLAQLAPAPGIAYTNRDRIPEQYLAFADAFHEVTGLVPTRSVISDWLQEFSVWLSEGIRPEHVRQARKEAGARISITRPGSLTRLAAAVKARGRAAGGAVKDAEWHRRAAEHTQRSVAEGRRRAAEWYRLHNVPHEDPETMRPRIEDLPKLLGVEPEEDLVIRPSAEARARVRELVKRLSVKKA